MSSSECSCSPSSMVHCCPTLPHFLPPVNPCRHGRADGRTRTCRAAGPGRGATWLSGCYWAQTSRPGRRRGPGPAGRRPRGRRTGAAPSSRRRRGSRRGAFSVSRSAMPGVRVLRRDRAAADVALRDHDRLADAHAAAAPRVFLVRLEPLDAEVHAEAAAVDRVDAELLARGRERRRREQRRGAAAAAVGRRQLRLDEPDRLARRAPTPRPPRDRRRAAPCAGACGTRVSISAPRSTVAARRRHRREAAASAHPRSAS